MTDSSDSTGPEPGLRPVPGPGPGTGQDRPICSLAQAPAGASLRVRQLNAPADVALRLRELGFCEQQRIRLLTKHTNVICQVCNVRLGISRDLAGMIMVETVAPGPRPAVPGKERPIS